MTLLTDPHRDKLQALLDKLSAAELPIDMPTIERSLIAILGALLASKPAPPPAADLDPPDRG
jgi:hypothetical protein